MSKKKKPELIEESCNETEGTFIVGPLRNPNIMNAAIRQALYSIKGVAPIEMEIKGAKSPFTPIEGVTEDFLYIAVTISELIFRAAKGFEEGEIKLQASATSNVGYVHAKRFECCPGIEIVNQDKLICTLKKGGSIDLRVKIKKDYDKKISSSIAPSSKDPKKEGIHRYPHSETSFTPIKSVDSKIRESQVGEEIKWNLIYRIVTNGSVAPNQAMVEAIYKIYEISGNLLEKDIPGIEE